MRVEVFWSWIQAVTLAWKHSNTEGGNTKIGEWIIWFFVTVNWSTETAKRLNMNSKVFTGIVIARYEAICYSFADFQKNSVLIEQIASLHCVTLLMTHCVFSEAMILNHRLTCPRHFVLNGSFLWVVVPRNDEVVFKLPK